MSVSAGADERQAICCTCGSIRSCRRPRNYREENYWLNKPVDRNWHRETGDLKCTSCGKTTRHALLYLESDNFKDHAERLERIALGSSDPMCDESDVVERIKKRYREGRQANPRLLHLWWTKDAEQARAEGRSWITAHCGDQVELLPTEDEELCHLAGTEPVEPDIDEDPVVFYDDDAPEGVGWEEIPCPNCYRITNERRVAALRLALLGKLHKLILAAQDLDAATVGRLISAAEEVMP
ncbi:Hypothetical protein ERS075576_04822 [Mycobacteroides abscessus]|uniref:hypothetical protein n=1 Tax=Mycobacteroides abscessus TaxID=36809 RepID=UPI0005DF0DA3|nr:hypothetical protein [Mycobacteroides abscessus]CPV67622.1 Hypothetical protein ERS075576_04822 [Mycobacteroides abscessus]SHQ50978.1 Uncharacterised protein [Mycobacteroides abscessus subsp. abscessus]SHR10745.1 Uncharacterised protein [Mycobacteroides abscessus subsp. abscessus]SHR11893.1 Uncharacterised protein [Mycobacteroides abscessus subsp. abscessus]SHR55544.1 Uncharacterised protein [Mycobacteroides abscessus subsp. abscessus]